MEIPVCICEFLFHSARAILCENVYATLSAAERYLKNVPQQ
jgi:hypothetical protein